MEAEKSAPRPRSISGDAQREIVAKVVDVLIKYGHLNVKEREGAIDDVANVASDHMDGYEIAKRLDSRHHWTCNMEMAEEFDNLSGLLSNGIRDAQRKWAAENNILPTHVIGTRVKVPRDQTGEITGIYEYGPASYLVKLDGDERAGDGAGRRRLVVAFEDAEPIPEPVSAPSAEGSQP